MKGLALFLWAALLVVSTSCANTAVPETVTPTLEPTEVLTPSPTWTPRPSPSPSPVATATFTPLPPTLTPSPTSPAAQTVVLEITEAELAERYKAWIEGVGLDVETVQVTLADEQMEILMQDVGIPIYMIPEFRMVGSYTVLDGRLSFQLEKVAPDAPWVWIITPTADDVMAGITKDIHVTQVEITDGKIIITGQGTRP